VAGFWNILFLINDGFHKKLATIEVVRLKEGSEAMLGVFWHWFSNPGILIAIVFLGLMSQSVFAFGEKSHNYWADSFLIDPLADQSNRYLTFDFSAKESFLIANSSNGRTTNTMSANGRFPHPYYGNTNRIYSKKLHSMPSDFDGRLLYVIDTLESLDTESLELRIGESALCAPSFNSCKSPELRLYSTSVDWVDPGYPEPIKFMLSVYRDRTIFPRRSIPAAMIVMYTENDPTKERTIIGYGKYGVYGTLTLLWEDTKGFPGTSFLQFGAAYDRPNYYQPFYDPDLKELMYNRQGQWISAGWRNSDLGSLQRVAKYLYYMLVGN
jgi:hypothetical protein